MAKEFDGNSPTIQVIHAFTGTNRIHNVVLGGIAHVFERRRNEKSITLFI